MNAARNQAPSIETHIPVTVEMPDEQTELGTRPDLPTPSLWQRSVQVEHKVTSKKAVVQKVDYATNMFRAYYPEEGELDETGKPIGRFAERTEWEHCRDWNVAVTFSPKELERQQARAILDAKVAKLDAKSLAAVSVLCDDADAAKALAKLNALIELGVIKAAPEVAQVALEEMKAEPAKGKR